MLIVNDFSQAFYSYIEHWSLSKIEHIPWSKKLLNFLLRVRLIRSLAGIIKSLVSSEVDIWVSVAATPRPPPIPRNDRQEARRISAQVYKLTKFGSKRANFGLVPSTQQPKRAEHTTQGGAELRHNLEKFLFPVFSVCKVDRKAPAFSCLETKGGFAKVGNLTVARKNKPRLSHCQQPGTFCSPILVSVTRGAKVATSPGPWGRKSMRLMGG